VRLRVEARLAAELQHAIAEPAQEHAVETKIIVPSNCPRAVITSSSRGRGGSSARRAREVRRIEQHAAITSRDFAA
jgi:hypothetical protein